MKLYLAFLSMHLKRRMAYRKSFFFSIIGQFLTAFSAFLTIWFLMSRFEEVKGFTIAECMLCAAVMWTAFALAECFFRGFDRFSALVRRAEFDRLMVRPRSLVFQVLCQEVEFTRVGRLVQAGVMLAWGVRGARVVWTAAKIWTLAGMILGGAMVFSGLFVIYAALCFFTLEGLEVVNCFTDGAREHGAYPIPVYGEGALKFATFVIPYALFQYYPLMYLLDRGPWTWGLAPLLTPLFLIPCYGLWRLGVRKYQSAGS